MFQADIRLRYDHDLHFVLFFDADQFLTLPVVQIIPDAIMNLDLNLCYVFLS